MVERQINRNLADFQRPGMTKAFSSILLLVAVLLLFGQCRKDQFTDDPNAVLEFSADTVLFDTIFNTVGSTTARLTVYNRNNRAVRVSNISLGQGGASQYRINVNGAPGYTHDNVEIDGNDSIFVFVEVTVDPTDSLHPFVEDKIHFLTNGNAQQVDLLAWGWDAIFYTPNVFPTNGLPPYRIINPQPNSVTTWTNEKPVVIYGYAVVDSTQKLIVEAGTQIFLHEGSGIWVYKDASIEVTGTAEEPVVFQGDRLEPFYQDQPGQWDRIWINEGSEDNIFEHATIRNSFIGIQAETLPFSYNATAPTSGNKLVLDDVRIYNTSLAGLLARNYRIESQNSLYFGSGQYVLAITGGGEYNFNQCTFANFWTFSSRQDPLMLITNAYENPPGLLQVRSIENTQFSNCIIYGNNDNELDMSFDTEGVNIDIGFEHTIVKYDTEEEDYSEYFGENVYVNEAPGFISSFENNYRLGGGAFAIDKGINTPSVSFESDLLDDAGFDLDENVREGDPDLGCFEYQP